MMKKRRRSSPDAVQEAAKQLYTSEAGWRMMPAGEFKAKCLRLMDEVRDTGEEIVITKHGEPVAKLVPLTGDDIQPFVGRSSGVIEATPEDLLAPEGADWEVGDDL
jgi:prevent-host-death family protein